MKTPINYSRLKQIDANFEALMENENVMKDGAICIRRYGNASLRVMWVLKQNIDYGYSDYSVQLLENLAKISSSPTWRRLAHASHGFLSGIRDFGEIKKEERNQCVESLSSSAIVEANKELGDTRSTDRSVHEGYRKYRNLIKDQMDAFAPDVVIACMVGKNENLKPVVESIYKDYTGESEYRIGGNSNPRFADVAWSKSREKIFLWAYHPSYTYLTDCAYFDGLMSAYDEAKKP